MVGEAMIKPMYHCTVRYRMELIYRLKGQGSPELTLEEGKEE